jgi:hypothetical protein
MRNTKLGNINETVSRDLLPLVFFFIDTAVKLTLSNIFANSKPNGKRL